MRVSPRAPLAAGGSRVRSRRLGLHKAPGPPPAPCSSERCSAGPCRCWQPTFRGADASRLGFARFPQPTRLTPARAPRRDSLQKGQKQLQDRESSPGFKRGKKRVVAERTWVQSVQPGDLGAGCAGTAGALGSWGKIVKAEVQRWP